MATPEAKPIIIRPKDGDNLPPEERFAMREGRVYRVFPKEAEESDVQKPCGSCGGSFDGPTQARCSHCSQGRQAFMLDVTELPFHLLPPIKKGEQPSVDASELLPRFGGVSVEVGENSVLESACGDTVTIHTYSRVSKIAANRISLGRQAKCNVAVAHFEINAADGFHNPEVDGGLAAKKISLGWGPNVLGTIVIPDGGLLQINGGPPTRINMLILGPKATFLSGDAVEVGKLVVLGPGTNIEVGNSSKILSLESQVSGYYSLKAGRGLIIKDHSSLSREYDLLGEINRLLDYALDPDR